MMSEQDLEPGCREALSKLYEDLDGELSAADREKLRAHLDACRPCLNHYEFERLFHEYVIAKVPRPKAREEFKAGLLARLRAERQAQPPSAGVAVRVMPRFALAASLVLLVGVCAWWLALSGTPEAADWQLLADYHYHRADVPGDGIETNCPVESREFVVERMGEETGQFVPQVIPEGLTIHEACVMPWKSTLMVQLEWRAQQEHVSLFVARASCLPLGSEPKLDWNGRTYYVVSRDGLNAVCWEEDGGYVCVMMAPTDFSTMFAWADELRGPGSF